MASYYYLSGYTTPAGITDRDGVRAIQQQLNAGGAGLKVDGIWGPKTDAAYNASNLMGGGAGGRSYAETQAGQLMEFYEAVRPLTSAATLSYTPRSSGEMRAEIAAYLRPGYESAIAAREAATIEQNAALDADAWARGMGRSTYVTDVKQRAYGDQESDIARLESEYSAALAELLAEAISTENARALEVERYNAEVEAESSRAALSLATSLYDAYLVEQQAARAAAAKASSGGRSSSSSSSSSKSKDVAKTKNSELFLSMLSPEERAAVYTGATELDRQYRDEIVASVGAAKYLTLQEKYPAA